MDWLVLKGSFPREPEDGDWDELTSLPGPPQFFEMLFWDVAGVELAWGCSVQLDIEKDEEIETRVFFCGTAELGCRVTERVVLISSDFPISVAVATHGLDGLEVRWDYAPAYQGQLGHCGFWHRWLSVSYADAAALARFEAVWRAVFGHAPVLSPHFEASEAGASPSEGDSHGDFSRCRPLSLAHLKGRGGARMRRHRRRHAGRFL